MLGVMRDIKVDEISESRWSINCSDSPRRRDATQSSKQGRFDRLAPHGPTLGDEPGVLAALEGKHGTCLEGQANGNLSRTCDPSSLRNVLAQACICPCGIMIQGLLTRLEGH